MNFHHHALVLEVVSQLHANGSWTGKTHVQKAFFLLQSRSALQKKTDFTENKLTSHDSPFEFVLYRHGPYSFELEHAIEEMSSYKALRIEPMNSYGVSLWGSTNVAFLREKAPLTEEEKAEINSVCRFIGNHDVKTLEQWATAVWIRQREGICETPEVAKRLHEVKPHISVADAMLADTTILPLIAGHLMFATA
jgi:uncharacterized protein YwgA